MEEESKEVVSTEIAEANSVSLDDIGLNVECDSEITKK